MALGKNIKKQKLIPDEAKKKSVSAPKKVGIKKRNLISRTKPESKKRESISGASSDLQNYIEKEVYERMVAVRKRFDEEIKQLADKRLQFVVFKVDTEEYAIEIDRVKEVVLTPPISKMPKMPDYIKGLANIRSRTILAIDLAQKFGLSNEGGTVYSLVVKSRKYSVAFLLPELPETVLIEGKNISGGFKLIQEMAKGETFIKGLIKIDNRLIYYLDTDELVNSDKAIVVPNKITNK